jgi:hypothetical protein
MDHQMPIPSMALRQHRTLWLALLGGVVAALIVQALLPGAKNDGSMNSGGFTLKQNGGPFPIGQQSTLEKAAAIVPFDIYMPATKELNDSTLTRVWVTAFESAETPQKLALEFTTSMGTVVIIEQLKEFGNPQQQCAKFVEDGIASASVETIANAPGLVIQPDTDSDGENPAYVETVQAGVDINIYSDEVLSQLLIDAAASMSTLNGSQ